MARFYWTANLADIGGPPSNLGIVQPWDPIGTFTVVDETAVQTSPIVPGVPATVEITHPTSISARRLAAFVSIDGVAIPETADVEIFMHVVPRGSGNESRNAVRADLSASTANATVLAGGLKRSENQTENSRYLNGSFVELNVGPGGGLDVFKQRVRAEGSTLFTKHWLAADPEPAEWTVISTNVDVLAAGAVGWFQFATVATQQPRIAAIGIGTDGDSAPTAPVATAGPEPLTGTLAAAPAGLAGIASGRLRQHGMLAAPVRAPNSAIAATLHVAGRLAADLPAPRAFAGAAAGSGPTLAVRLGALLAAAFGRLRIRGALALRVGTPRIAAAAATASAGFALPPAGRRLARSAETRLRQIAPEPRRLASAARPDPFIIASEETGND